MFAPSMTMMRYDEFLVHTSSDVNGGSWWRFTPASMDVASAKSSMITDTAIALELFWGVLVRRLCLGSSEDAGAPGAQRHVAAVRVTPVGAHPTRDDVRHSTGTWVH